MNLFDQTTDKHKNWLPYEGTVNYYGRILSKEPADFYLIEKETGESFNSCLLNLYHNGDEGMAWHSDDKTDLKKDGAIGSLSFGAERKFAFKHKQTKAKIELILEHGSLLIMKGTTQTYWLHRLPPGKKITAARVNLTFRTITE